MKKTILVTIICGLTIGSFAQTDTENINPSIKAGWSTLDYAVPESPAFKMLGASPDNIMQPTSVKSIALNVGNYYLTNGSTIPKNLAVEISPLLINQKASLIDYKNNKFLYRARLSLGTTVSDNGSYNIAEGIRFTIIDKTDLRTNTTAIHYFNSRAAVANASADTFIARYAATHPGDCSNNAVCIDRFFSDPVFKKMVMDAVGMNFDSIADFRDRMRQQLWNAEIMEVGLGAVQVIPDSLLTQNVSVYKAGIWLTYGNHFSKNDQILFGGKFSYVDSMSSSHLSASLGTRYFYGSNELRGFVQVEYVYEGDIQSTVGSAGCIFKITNGLWGNFTMGFVYDENSKLSYRPSFNVSFGTPEKKKL